MDNFKILMEHQLTEKEIMIFLLISSGEISTHKLGKILLLDHTTIVRIFAKAKAKIDKLAEAGLFSTEIN